MDQISLTADRLILDTSNARKMRDKDSLASLKASILAHGIIQPIAVRPPEPSERDLQGQLYRVAAGGRRYSAVVELIAEGKIEPTFEIPALVKDVDDDTADEMSLAENILRREMRPVDEFKAFSRLAEAGASADEIALRFGQSVRFVRGRMALGKLHPSILDALDTEVIGFEAAAAYTIEADTERQIEVFNRLDQWDRRNAMTVKRALSGNGLRASSQVVTFVGLDRYVEAGGKVVADLFSEETFITNPEIVEQLKLSRIEEVRADLIADGWSFVKTTEELSCNVWELRTLTPDETSLSEEDTARMDELSAILDQYAEADPEELDEDEEYQRLQDEYESFEKRAVGTYSAERKAQSGVVIRTDGTFSMSYGIIEPGAKAGAGTAEGEEKKTADPLKIPAPVLEQMGDAATLALQDAIVVNPDLALAFLAASLETGDDNITGIKRPCRVKIERVGMREYGAGDKQHRSFWEAFQHYAALSPDDLKQALAEMTAKAADLTEKWFTQHWIKEDQRPAARREALDAFDASPGFHFDRDAFFAGVKKPLIAAAFKEMTGQDLKDGKKADMAALASDAAKKTGWLPEGLRTARYKLQKPGKKK